MYIDAYRLIQIGAVLVVLLVFFGGPDRGDRFKVRSKDEKWMEDIQEQASAKSKNPLAQYGISGGKSGSTAAALANMPQSGSPSYYNPYQQQPDGQVQGMPNLQYPSYGTQPGSGGTGLPMPYQTNNYNPQPVQGYVPPNPNPGGVFDVNPESTGGKPLPAPGSNRGPAFPQAFPRWSSPSANGPRSEAAPTRTQPGYTLRGGQRIFTSGSNVYVYDENGQPKPMPDGDYIDEANSRVIVVRDGKRLIAN